MAKIKGVWVFNQKFADGEFNFTVTGISFTSYNMEFEGINPSGSLASSGGYKSVMYYKRKGAMAWDVIAQSSYHGYATGWQNDAFRTVDFGETEQTVPDDFYAWMQKNAVQQVVRTVKGKWLFNETISPRQYGITQEINFTSAEFTCTGFTLSGKGVNLTAISTFSYNGVPNIDDYIGNVYREDMGWRRPECRMVDFGEAEQTMKEEFYAWFIANATQQAEPEEPTTPKRKFTKLFLGDVVKTVGSRVFRKLSTQEPITEITDLTGTTWYFDVGWTSSAGYGQFTINAILDRAYDESLADVEVAQMMVGYRDLGTPKEIENYVKFVNPKGGTLALSNTRNFILKFTGGVDATNKDLISWVTQNGTQQGANTTLITFTIAGTSYQAEEGMTWHEWVNSEYNTASFVCNNPSGLVYENINYIRCVVTSYPIDVYGRDYIINGEGYSFRAVGGSND